MEQPEASPELPGNPVDELIGRLRRAPGFMELLRGGLSNVLSPVPEIWEFHGNPRGFMGICFMGVGFIVGLMLV